MRNAHARLIGTAVVMVAGAVVYSSDVNHSRVYDAGGVILGAAGVLFVIEYLVMLIVPDRPAKRTDRERA